jgi:hypothetical protein
MARFILALSFALIPACDSAGACADEPTDVVALVARADADTLDAIAADVCPEDAATAPAPEPEPRSVDGGAAPATYIEGDAYPEDPFRFGCDLPAFNIAEPATARKCAIMLAACVDASIEQCDEAKACQVKIQQCEQTVEQNCWAKLP